MAFDGSEVPDVENEESSIKWEPYTFDLLRNQLFQHYSAQPDEEDRDQRPISQILDPDDLKEYFEEDWGGMYFFRLKPPSQVASADQLLSPCIDINCYQAYMDRSSKTVKFYKVEF